MRQKTKVFPLFVCTQTEKRELYSHSSGFCFKFVLKMKNWKLILLLYSLPQVRGEWNIISKLLLNSIYTQIKF